MRFRIGDLVRVKSFSEEYNGCQAIIHYINGEYIHITIAGYDCNFHHLQVYRNEIEHYYPKKVKYKRLPEDLFTI